MTRVLYLWLQLFIDRSPITSGDKRGQFPVTSGFDSRDGLHRGYALGQTAGDRQDAQPGRNPVISLPVEGTLSPLTPEVLDSS